MLAMRAVYTIYRKMKILINDENGIDVKFSHYRDLKSPGCLPTPTCVQTWNTESKRLKHFSCNSSIPPRAASPRFLNEGTSVPENIETVQMFPFADFVRRSCPCISIVFELSETTLLTHVMAVLKAVSSLNRLLWVCSNQLVGWGGSHASYYERFWK